MIEIFQFAFMQRALLGGLVLGFLLAILGIFVVLKRMSFYSDGIAHASLAGVALGILSNTNPLFVAIIFSGILGAIISWLERKTKIASDAIIGMFFTSGMALGVILLALKQGYQPELVSFLFGNILALQWNELYIIIVATVIMVVFLAIKYKQVALMILNSDLAHVSGINVGVYTTLLYVIIAISVVLGIKLLGIVLVSALLIVPVSTAKLFAKSLKSLTVWSVVISELTIILGLLISVKLNMPTGATIVLSGICIFFLFFIVKHFDGFFPKKQSKN
ncbi:metal ABC transporter permease [Patescibacteria group bacterium]|nr:metal ABC transporter permease [Patescibacteria group bacterium]